MAVLIAEGNNFRINLGGVSDFFNRACFKFNFRGCPYIGSSVDDLELYRYDSCARIHGLIEACLEMDKLYGVPVETCELHFSPRAAAAYFLGGRLSSTDLLRAFDDGDTIALTCEVNGALMNARILKELDGDVCTVQRAKK